MLFPFQPDFLATASSLGHFVKFRAFDRGIAWKEENGEAVCIVQELPFSQDNMDLAFGSVSFIFIFCLLALSVSYLFPNNSKNNLNSI